MSTTFLIARNEIRRQLRDRSALIRGLVAPFVGIKLIDLIVSGLGLA